jgi:hypothetical protein
MNIESPIFDNIYFAAGVMGLLVLLLIVLLTYGRRRSSARREAAVSKEQPAPPEEILASDGELLQPQAGTVVSTPGSPSAPTETRPAPTRVGMGEGAADSPSSNEAVNAESNQGAASGASSSTTSIAPGDPAAAVITALVEESGELNDAALRRLELFRPARVIAVADSMAPGLSGKGKETRRLRLNRIRQYAESLQAQVAAAGMSPKPPPDAGPSTPPPGSGTAVSAPEMWGTADTAQPLPLDHELSFNSGELDPLTPVVPDSSAYSPEAVASAETETASAEGESPTEDGTGAGDDTPVEDGTPVEVGPRRDILETPVADGALPARMPPNGGPPPSSDVGLWAAVPEPIVSLEPPVFAEWNPSQQKAPLGLPSTQPAPAEAETPVPSPPLYAPDDPIEPSVVEEVVDPVQPSVVEEVVESPVAGVESPGVSDQHVIRDGWENPAVVDRDTPETLNSMSPEELGRVLREPVDRATKLAVLGALENMGTARALSVVEGCFEDPDPEVLLRALDAAEHLLAELNGPPV